MGLHMQCKPARARCADVRDVHVCCRGPNTKTKRKSRRKRRVAIPRVDLNNKKKTRQNHICAVIIALAVVCLVWINGVCNTKSMH